MPIILPPGPLSSKTPQSIFHFEPLGHEPDLQYYDASMNIAEVQYADQTLQHSSPHNTTNTIDHMQHCLTLDLEDTIHPIIDSYLTSGFFSSNMSHPTIKNKQSTFCSFNRPAGDNWRNVLPTTTQNIFEKISMQGWSAEEIIGVRGISNEQLLMFLVHFIDNDFSQGGKERQILLPFMKIVP